MAAMLYFFFEWWCTAGATVHSKGVGSLEIRHLERVDLHELPDSEWCGLESGKVMPQPFLRPEYTTENKQHVTGL